MNANAGCVHRSLILSVFRMLGSTSYLFIQIIHGFVEGKVKLEPERIKERWTIAPWMARWRRNGWPCSKA